MFATACRTLAADEQHASQVPRTSLAEFAQAIAAGFDGGIVALHGNLYAQVEAPLLRMQEQKAVCG
jgi:hypothetical protein